MSARASVRSFEGKEREGIYIIVKEPESQFIQAPAGVHSAVCVDEIDMGLVPNRFDPASDPIPTVRIVWQIGEQMEDGKPYLVKKDYRASLHEKAGLRADLNAWRGRPFTFDELVGFDLENIVGVQCMLNLVEKLSKKGKKFTNIASIMPLPKGMTKLEPRDYIRTKDRPQSNGAAKQHLDSSVEIGEDDIPF